VALSVYQSSRNDWINYKFPSWFPKTPSLIELPSQFQLTISLVRCRYYFTNVGTTTGISAHDRALTARKLADPKETDGAVFTRPGHIFPLRYTEGGVLQRAGHTEASVGSSLAHFLYSAYFSDLCKLAGLQPAAIICELVRDQDGLMARRDDCVTFAKKFGLRLITIAALVEYLKRKQLHNGSS
jgi:3,4-dihydroxy-2-butanone 4-phosphate synthase